MAVASFDADRLAQLSHGFYSNSTKHTHDWLTPFPLKLGEHSFWLAHGLMVLFLSDMDKLIYRGEYYTIGSLSSIFVAKDR